MVLPPQEHYFSMHQLLSLIILYQIVMNMWILHSPMVSTAMSQSEIVNAPDASATEFNSGNATSVTVTDITTNSGRSFGGEETIRIHLSFNDLPSGVETIMVAPSGRIKYLILRVF